MGASDRGALPRFRLRKATGATSSEADSGRHRRNGLAASAQCNGGRPIVTTHAFVSGSHVVRDTQRLGGDPSRPRKRGSAPWLRLFKLEPLRLTFFLWPGSLNRELPAN